MDKKRTWGACAAAVYLIRDNKMQTETALKICKELGAITIDDLEGVNRENIYGDVVTDHAGLSLSESEKGELNQICVTARAEAAGAKAKADAEAAAAKAAAAKLEVIMSKSRAEPEEMGEGTYSGEKLEGRRHGRGFMFPSKIMIHTTVHGGTTKLTDSASSKKTYVGCKSTIGNFMVNSKRAVQSVGR